jgi:small conductance mechanosensitive channel
MPFWHRLLIALAVVAVATVIAKLIDMRLARRELRPELATRYRVLRRSVMTGVIAIGVISALLTIPQVQAVAGGVLASSAVVGLVLGFAARSTLANFVAGLLIAFTQPVRLGDRVEVAGVVGTVEEIGLTYTFIRTEENARLVIPNEKLASDTIRNWTIRNPEKVAQITMQVPLQTDLATLLGAVREAAAGEREPDVFVSALDGQATITLRAWAGDPAAAERLERDLRLRAHAQLRERGVFA